jgi:hypothetical protein
MKAQPQFSNAAEHAGAAIGRTWWRWLRQERRLIDWLVSKGLPARTAKMLLWIVKLVAFGALLYAVFWLALLIALAIVATWSARNVPHSEKAGEWRNGPDGYGYYEDRTRTDYGRLFEDDQT